MTDSTTLLVATPISESRAKQLAPWLVRGAYLAVAIALLVAGLTTEGFFSVANVKAILSSTTWVGIIAIGMTMIMMSGSLVSLSLGTTAAIAAMFFIFSLPLGLVGAIVVTLLVGALIGGAQGLAVGVGANPIILTFAAGIIQEGVAVWRSGGATINPVGDSFKILNSTPLGIPLSVYVLVAFAVVVELGIRRTRVGREIELVGESEPAARAAGLSGMKIAVVVFGTAGVAAAISGVLLGAYNQSASLLLTGNLTFDAIAATLVAGTAVGGGSGSALRTLGGAVTIAALSNLLLLHGLSAGWQVTIKGLIVLVIAVLIHLRGMVNAAS